MWRNNTEGAQTLHLETLSHKDEVGSERVSW